MAFTVGVPVEQTRGEKRVALTPDAVGKLGKKGITTLVERGAGSGAYYADALYEAQGATLVSRGEAFAADVVVKVQPPSAEEILMMRSGSAYVGFLSPLDRPETAEALAERGITALAMELVPRTTRAQKMDALSAMASIIGYRAVLMAASALPRFFPLLTTAAGTVRPASVLILGAGVAGLQAIATARRLGARVSAYDVRAAAKEEVQSLGAAFVELDLGIGDMQDAGGYARALAEEKQRRQTELLVPHIAKADVVITTAQIPGRRAPVLVTEEAVAAMAPGSVIIDCAAATGGNVAGSQPDTEVQVGGVRLLGPTNLASETAQHASDMYGRTIMAMLLEFAGEAGFEPRFEDDIFAASCVTHGGQVVNERVRGILVR